MFSTVRDNTALRYAKQFARNFLRKGDTKQIFKNKYFEGLKFKSNSKRSNYMPFFTLGCVLFYTGVQSKVRCAVDDVLERAQREIGNSKSTIMKLRGK